MASPASQGRRRTQGKATTEDQALNTIASEAEARLAAKRAARAEARVIRMRELERMQQEADEKMDREFHQRSMISDDPLKTRPLRVTEKLQSRISPSTENEMNGPVSQESQIRTLQDNLREVNEKYKKAMVSNAQLDNEKQALAYQVDCLKDRLEDAEEVIENIKHELLDKTRELNRLSRENKNNIEELEKTREQLIIRDKLLEEHGIPTDGSEQPDMTQLEVSSRVNDTLHIDSIDLDQSVTNKSRNSSRRSSAPDDRDSLLEQIKLLKDQVTDLRRNPEFDEERSRDVESLQTSDEQIELNLAVAERDLERSEAFEDVTNEAIEIHDRFHTGMIVNNNERNEDFDVIDQNLRHDEISNFEDKSYERSSCLTESVNDSITDSMLESYRSNIADDSMESEKPLEISISAAAESTPVQKITGERHPFLGKEVQGVKDLVDYDIVESATGSPALNRSKAGNNPDDMPFVSVGNKEKSNEEVNLVSLEPTESQPSSEELDVSPASEVFFVADDFVAKRIIAEEEATGSDIVEIELPVGSATDSHFNDKPDEVATPSESIGLNPLDEILAVERVGSDIVDIEIPGASSVRADSEPTSEDTSISPEIIRVEQTEKVPASVPLNETATESASVPCSETNKQNSAPLSLNESGTSSTNDLKSDIVHIDLPVDTAKDTDNHEITPPQLKTDSLKEKSKSPDEEGFDNIEPEEIFEDAKSEFSEEFSSLGSKEGDRQDPCVEDLEHFEEVDVPSEERKVGIADEISSNVSANADDVKSQRVKLGSGEEYFSVEEATGENQEMEKFEQVDSPSEERGQEDTSPVIMSAPTADSNIEASKEIKSETGVGFSSREAGEDEFKNAEQSQKVNVLPEERVTNNIDSLQANSLDAVPVFSPNVIVSTDLSPVDLSGDVPVLQNVDTQGKASPNEKFESPQQGIIDIEGLTESGNFDNGMMDSEQRDISKEIDISKMIDDTPETVKDNEVSATSVVDVDGGFVSSVADPTSELPVVNLREKDESFSILVCDETTAKVQRISGEDFEEVDVSDIELQKNMEAAKDSAFKVDENGEFYEIITRDKVTESQDKIDSNVEPGKAMDEVTDSIASSNDKLGASETECIKKVDEITEVASEQGQTELQPDEPIVSEDRPSEALSTQPELAVASEDVESNLEESAAHTETSEKESIQPDSEPMAGETRSEDIIEIPDKDYPSVDVQIGAENTHELSVQRPADLDIKETKVTAEIQGAASLMQRDADQAPRGSTPDKLLVEFETRTRLGSMSPESMRKGSFKRITPQASPESVRREPPKELSPQPVPKERKKNKKKKKKKKGTIKMLVQEMVSPSQDSDGTEDDTMEEPPSDDVTQEGTNEQNEARESPEISSNSETEGKNSEKKDERDTQGIKSQVVMISEKEGNSEKEGDSEKEVELKKEVDIENEAMTIPNQESIEENADAEIAMVGEVQEEKDDVAPMEVRRQSVGSTSETSDVEAGGKAKGKDKRKSKKESKKDGCKSQ
eukprot:Seg1707.9 transcript_id=Seg1707.9/GoldUCD/mRNA.D3Y31 product="Leucine-rich repeat flightless-interacting protein 2" protein_id=Seg1707.9/GoldUCD/D3Y31